MQITPKPKRIFIFTPEEFSAVDFSRFKVEIDEIRSLPAREKRRLMGSCIFYPQVLTGSVSYAKILSDTKMRTFISSLAKLFPEWLFFLHTKNIFAPVQLFAQLAEILVIEAGFGARIRAPRSAILTLLLDAVIPARAVSENCGISPSRFAQQVSDVFGLARFDLARRDAAVVPEMRFPQRKIILTSGDLNDSGIEKVRASFARVDPRRNRAAFGFELTFSTEGELPDFYYDSMLRFFRRVFIEVPECAYFLRAHTEGITGVVNCVLQLEVIKDRPADLESNVSVTSEQVFLHLMKIYPVLRKFDRENGFSSAHTIEHLDKIAAGFQLLFCPSISSP